MRSVPGPRAGPGGVWPSHQCDVRRSPSQDRPPARPPSPDRLIDRLTQAFCYTRGRRHVCTEQSNQFYSLLPAPNATTMYILARMRHILDARVAVNVPQ